jgi:hypothetical protein
MRDDLLGHLGWHAVGDPIVAGQLDPDDESIATDCTDRSGGFDQQATASFKIATVFIVATVGTRRHELMEQMAMARRDFDPRKAATHQAERRIGG